MLFLSFSSGVDIPFRNQSSLIRIYCFEKGVAAICLVVVEVQEEILNIGDRAGLSCPLYNLQLASSSNAVAET